MKTKTVLTLLAALALCVPARAQTQVSGAVSSAINLTAVNPLSVGSSSYPLSLSSFIQATLATGNGANKANSLIAVQWTVTNGFGRVLDLSGMGGQLDPLGNAYTNSQIKLLAFQNLGVAGSPFETNLLRIIGTNTSDTFTNFLGVTNSGLSLPGPYATPTGNNTPTAIFWALGDVGWQIGPNAGGTNHDLILTNPNPGIITVNIYAVGSTGT